jgi:membrane protease YdiL (CAAX protease family)
LGFGSQRGWQLVIGAAAVAAAAVFLEIQRRRVTKDPALQVEFRKKVENALPILPTDAKELFLFHLVSVTAGVCEELLYRGFLVWYIAEGLGLGLVVGVALSSLLFGLAHLYQGRKGIVQTGIVGLIFALLYVATGSLWAPMLLHALVDMNSGILWYQIRGSGDASSQTTSETRETSDTGASNDGVTET